MSFREFDTVVMKADMPSRGLKSGAVGDVVQLYSADAAEMEFVLPLAARKHWGRFRKNWCGRSDPKDILAARQGIHLRNALRAATFLEQQCV